MSKRGKRNRHDKQHSLLIDGKNVRPNKRQRRAIKYRMFWVRDPLLNKLYAEEIVDIDEVLKEIDLSKEFEEILAIEPGGFKQIYKGPGDPFPNDIHPIDKLPFEIPDSEDESPRTISSRELIEDQGVNIYSIIDNRSEEERDRISRAWHKEL